MWRGPLRHNWSATGNMEFTTKYKELTTSTPIYNYVWGRRWRGLLRHCATHRKVVGSIPDSVITIFHWHSPFGRTMALGSTQPLMEMSIRSISWGEGGKGGRCVRLTILPPSWADCLEIWKPQPPGTLQACNMPEHGLLYLYHNCTYNNACVLFCAYVK